MPETIFSSFKKSHMKKASVSDFSKQESHQTNLLFTLSLSFLIQADIFLSRLKMSHLMNIIQDIRTSKHSKLDRTTVLVLSEGAVVTSPHTQSDTELLSKCGCIAEAQRVCER